MQRNIPYTPAEDISVKTFWAIAITFVTLGVLITAALIIWELNSPSARNIANVYVENNSSMFVDKIVEQIYTESSMLPSISDDQLKDHVSTEAKWKFSPAKHLAGKRYYAVTASAYVVSNVGLTGSTSNGFEVNVPFRLVIDMDSKSVARYEIAPVNMVAEEPITVGDKTGTDAFRCPASQYPCR